MNKWIKTEDTACITPSNVHLYMGYFVCNIVLHCLHAFFSFKVLTIYFTGFFCT